MLTHQYLLAGFVPKLGINKKQINKIKNSLERRITDPEKQVLGIEGNWISKMKETMCLWIGEKNE